MLNGLVPERRLASAGRQHVRSGARGVDRDQAGAHDLLHIIGVAAAVVAVVHADDCDAARLRLRDGELRAAIRGDVADIVAAIDQRGHRRLVHHAYRRARLAGLLVLGDRENARQAGEAVAAQRVVDQLIGDDGRFVGRIADAAQRRLAELRAPRLRRAGWCRVRPDRATSASLERAAPDASRRRRGRTSAKSSVRCSFARFTCSSTSRDSCSKCQRRARTVERTPNGGFFATAAAISRATCHIVAGRRDAIDDAGCRRLLSGEEAAGQADIGGKGSGATEIQQCPVFRA